MKRFALSALILFVLSSAASAAIIAEFTSVANDAAASPNTPPPGTVSQDLTVTTDTDWGQAHLFLNLTAGGIYRSSTGFEDTTGKAPLIPAIIAGFPAIRWDSYWKGWGALGADSSVSSPGGSDFGGNPAVYPAPATTNGNKINVAWGNTNSGDIGTSTLGRFTLSDTATGTWQLRIYAGGGQVLTTNGNVVGGSLAPVPEPGAIVLAGIAIPALAYAIRRRRKAA